MAVVDQIYAHPCWDGQWLHHTKKALEKIKTAAEKLEATQNSPNDKLKQEIIKAAEDGLITHI